MRALVELLKSKNVTIASVESLTAGLFASKIAEVAGASSVLKGGLITYQTSCKREVLHIDSKLIDKYGVVSEQVAQAMAKNGKALFNSDIVVSFSGNAGPDVMEEKPVGYVCMAIAYQDQVDAFHYVFKGSRNEIRTQVCEYMSDKLIILLNKI